MAFTLGFSTDNAAFCDGDGAMEIARILRHMAERIERYPEAHCDTCSVYDLNGNRIGSMEFDLPEQDDAA